MDYWSLRLVVQQDFVM